jgi:hypothetical protein
MDRLKCLDQLRDILINDTQAILQLLTGFGGDRAVPEVPEAAASVAFQQTEADGGKTGVDA